MLDLMPGGMVRRRRVMPKPLTDNGWVVDGTLRFNGRVIEPGRKISVTGMKRGAGTRLTFVRAVTNAKGESWIDLESAGGRRHSVTLDRIKTVHNA